MGSNHEQNRNSNYFYHAQLVFTTLLEYHYHYHYYADQYV